MKRPVTAEKVKGAPAAVTAGVELVEVGERTTEWMATTAWDDGKPRMTGTVMVLAEQGLWKAWLHDRDGRRSSWVSSETLPGLWQAIEERLESATGDWRADKK